LACNMRIQPNLAFERELWGRGLAAVAGVDEVGVGAFAGPVVAAAVILAPHTVIDGLADSKLLSAKHREKLFAVISAGAIAVGTGRAEVEEVDGLNVYWAATEGAGGRSRRYLEHRLTSWSTASADRRLSCPADGGGGRRRTNRIDCRSIDCGQGNS
jgi:Ribonuclease HII